MASEHTMNGILRKKFPLEADSDECMIWFATETNVTALGGKPITLPCYAEGKVAKVINDLPTDTTLLELDGFVNCEAGEDVVTDFFFVVEKVHYKSEGTVTVE